MSSSSSSTPRKPQIDVRQLSLVQLQALAARGSRRARQELEARMAAAPAPPPAPPAPPPPRARERARAIPPAEPPVLQPGALGRMPAPAPAPAPAASAAAAGFGDADDPRIQQLQFMAQQDREEAQTRGLPRLIGLLLMGWGGLILFAGLVTLANRGGGYYLVMGAATIGVGWVLFQCKSWAIHLQAAVVLIALVWAWANSRGIAGMLVQAIPFWTTACWMAVPQVREPLE